MIHSEEIHVERLNSICRICAKKSKASSKEAKAVDCVRFAPLIKEFYSIDIQNDNQLQHSTVMCSSCKKRLERCKRGQQQNLDLQKDITFSESIWSKYDSGKQLSECTVCLHAEKLSLGGRPRGRKNAKKQLNSLFGEMSSSNAPTLDLSTSSSISSQSLMFEDNTDSQSFVGQPSTSTPDKTNKETDLSQTQSPIRSTFEMSTSYTPVKTAEVGTNTTPGKQIRSPDKIQLPLTDYEEKVGTAMVKKKLESSADKSTVSFKTRGRKLHLMKIVKAEKSSSRVCSAVLRRRSKALAVVKDLLGVKSDLDMILQTADELKTIKKPDRQDIFKKAGIRSVISLSSKQGAALRTTLGISWSRYRTLRRCLRHLGILQAGEKKVRAAQKAALCGRVEIRVIDLEFDNSNTQEKELKATPVAYIGNLREFVLDLLAKYKKSGELEWHGQIPDNEIWIKIGGDHGGGSLKIMLQVANLRKPNSKHNTFLICITNAKDSHTNLAKVLGHYKDQIDELSSMMWEGKRTRIFTCGDLDFLLKNFGLSSAASCHPCLLCKVSKKQLQISPKARPTSEKRTLKNLKDDHFRYVKAGRIKKKAKAYSNVIHKAILRIKNDPELKQVVPPYLHVLLGVVKKHHSLLEKNCNKLDKEIADSLAETGEDITNRGFTCKFMDFVEEKKEILKQESRLNLLQTEYAVFDVPDDEALASLAAQRNAIYDRTTEIMQNIEELKEKRTDLPLLYGPVTANLDNVLKNNKIQMQAYHGRSMVSNHCHKNTLKAR